jgi:hypothetical protein
MCKNIKTVDINELTKHPDQNLDIGGKLDILSSSRYLKPSFNF